mmetsp:Transcript_54381/g.157236  ORF Transcript_54381/g.157236 Transcript_54381/m.157236 type:complete len:839 (-) Transcript_54381:127-2643(-)
MGNSDSHAAFVDGVKRLLDEDVPEPDQEFWSSLFSAPMSAEDIFEIVGPDHVRQLRSKRPGNLQALLRGTVAAMAQVCSAADESGALSAPQQTAANTTVRLLTRVVPFLVEDKEDEVLTSILWRPGGYAVSSSALPVGEAGALSSNGVSEAALKATAEETLADGDIASASPTPAEPLEAMAPAFSAVSPAAPASAAVLGDDILYHIGRFLFLPGYTVSPRTKMTGKDRGPIPTHRVDDRVIWKGGVGAASQVSAMPVSQAVIRTRVEVLRCVLACLSGPLFQTADEYQEEPPRWLLRFTGGEVCHTANLFCSLMSTVFCYDPVGWGVPYGGYFSGDQEEEIVDIALQVLCVVMDFDPQDANASVDGNAGTVVQAKPDEGESEYIVDNSQLQAGSHGLAYRKTMQIDDMDSTRTALWGTTVCGKEEDGWLKVSDGYFLPFALKGKQVLTLKTSKKSKLRNVYRYMLQSIHKDIEIDLIFTNLVRMLSTVYKANQTLLPNSVRPVGFFQEALVLLWHLLTLNTAFTRRVVDHLDTNQVLLPVLYLLQQAQNAPHLVGLLHTASFVLLVLSSERSFSVRLNEPFTEKLSLRIPAFQGCHADLVALTLHKVISDSLPRPANDALVEMLLTVLCNVSPYVKAFALESCLKLVALIDRCARPAYLFRSAFTHHGLGFLIEMVNNIIQYQFEGNSMLVYSVLRQKEVFQSLADLKLPPPRTKGDGSTGGEAVEATWVPTEEWVKSIQKKLPLQAILCLIEYMSPQIEELCKMSDVTDQNHVLKFLKTTTMVGILPVPHPIVIRTYQASTYTSMWFTSYMWGVIFTRSQRMPLYDWKKIRLVIINQ